MAPISASPAAHRVGLVLTDNLPIFELAVPCEVFGIARPDLHDPWYELTMVRGEPGEIATAGGLAPSSAAPLAALREMDTIVVPACERSLQVEGATHAPLLAELRAAAGRGARIASLCSGAYLLAQAGLLDGRDATTHWMNWEDFEASFPRVRLRRDVLLTSDAGVYTSAGTAAGIELCLQLVREDFGEAVAASVARRMVVAERRGAAQSEYLESVARPLAPDPLRHAMDWAEKNLHAPIGPDAMARRARMSRRTLYRRFEAAAGTSPSQWLLERRIDSARRLLEETDLPVERVAERAGVGSAANLRAHFARIVGMSPSAYREAQRRDARRRGAA
ncbi:transcriptional regulator GlxA family with amidase domain [Sinomonas atrocyanea]|uniref:GlxA family transcriptional regulator n=1 Tax=Sinomonas atrocyanea TaxID=37927 RepID=UPI002784E894|nr:helix-turn-helix domain-containing protein [Sinomonas atrocyanea]MDP9885061.1 transcriptional regulator GlxA family with amidase domain [Sinomonas atrocyanea]